MLYAVVKKGVTTENVTALEKLCGLYERMEAASAEKAFASAFVALQAEMPILTATTAIPNRGKYEKFEDVMRVIGPLLVKHGFSIRFSNEAKDGRVIETCHLMHSGGVTKTNPFAVRVGKADTETQADCKAATTAKRNALLNALNVVIQQDCMDSEHDAAIEGGRISDQQAESLRQRVMATASDEAAFLKLAGAKEYKEIRVAFYQMLDLCLKRREKTS